MTDHWEPALPERSAPHEGGGEGANIFPPFLPRGTDSTIEDFLDVIDYLLNLVGIDHVGIGTDFTQCLP